MSLSPSDTAAPLPSGTFLGDYEIEHVLGQGEFGIVYAAIDHRLHRRIALKEHFPKPLCRRYAGHSDVLPSSSQYTQDYEHSLRSFCKEARTLAQLDHPNIVHIHDIFQACETAYLVMSYVEGATLGDWLEAHAKDAEAVEQMLITLLQTLSYIHKKYVLHRDLKPSNIIITQEGQPVLVDFGAARDGLSKSTITLIGSPAYAPPEQFTEQGELGPWTDIFALGRSFSIPLKKALHYYPSRLTESLRRATELDIQRRYASCQEWLATLQPSKSRTPAIAMTTLLALTATGGAAFYFFSSSSSESATVQIPLAPPHLETVAVPIATIPAPDLAQSPRITSTPTPQPPVSTAHELAPAPAATKSNTGQAPTDGDLPAHQSDHPRGAPAAPLSIEGTRITLSSDHPLLRYGFTGGDDIMIAAQLSHYQATGASGWSDEADPIFVGTMDFRTDYLWKLGEQSGSYVYRKISHDKGLIDLRENVDGESFSYYMLLHFSEPHAGIALYTDGDKGIIGNTDFRIESDFPHYLSAANRLPAPEPAQSPDAEIPPPSLVGLNIVFELPSSNSLETRAVEEQLGDHARQAAMEKRLLELPYEPPSILFTNEYTCAIAGKAYSYIYKPQEGRNQALLELSDLPGQPGELYYLLRFTSDREGTAVQYDGSKRMHQGITFKLLDTREAGSDRGIMPQSYFKQAWEAREK